MSEKYSIAAKNRWIEKRKKKSPQEISDEMAALAKGKWVGMSDEEKKKQLKIMNKAKVSNGK